MAFIWGQVEVFKQNWLAIYVAEELMFYSYKLSDQYWILAEVQYIESLFFFPNQIRFITKNILTTVGLVEFWCLAL